MKKPVAFTLDDKMVQALKEKARQETELTGEKVTVSALVRRAIREILAQDKRERFMEVD